MYSVRVYSCTHALSALLARGGFGLARRHRRILPDFMLFL
jgi:hypothetical protein